MPRLVTRMRRIAWLLLLSTMLASGGLAYGYAGHRWALARAPLELVVEQGDTARTLAASLRRQGVALPTWAFVAAARLRGDATRLRAGSFELEHPVSLRELLDRLVRGDPSQREVRLIEGWTFRQIRQALAAQPMLRQELPQLSDAQLLARLGASEPGLEGLFHPDTYSFAPQSSDVSLLQRAYRRQQQLLADTWARRRPDSPLRTPYEALVLASIVEKETGRAEDRPHVAGVFLNRLRRGMLLQSDPTTIYGLGEAFDGNLRRRDLLADTPYNTYVRAGLPPTPIAAPGLAALRAVVEPAPTSALYFVARGDGSSQFSDTLEAHNRAVRQFQKGR